MNRTFAITFAVGIAVVAVAITGVLFMQRGARVGLTGKISKVRTAALDENSTIAVLDFRFVNPSNVMFQVEHVSVVMEENDGKQYEGKVVAESDARRLFDAIPLLGQKFNETLMTREKILPRGTADRMVAARFDAPEARIQARKRFLLRIEDVDGPVTELPEK